MHFIGEALDKVLLYMLVAGAFFLLARWLFSSVTIVAFFSHVFSYPVDNYPPGRAGRELNHVQRLRQNFVEHNPLL